MRASEGRVSDDETNCVTELFAKLLHEVGLGRPSLDVLRELLANPDPRYALGAVRLVVLRAPAVPDWYWHPGLLIPPQVEEQIDELQSGKRKRVSFTEPGVLEAREMLLEEAKLPTAAREAAKAEIRNARSLYKTLPSTP